MEDKTKLTIEEFIIQEIKKYNNIRILLPMFKDITESIKRLIVNYMKEYFEEYPNYFEYKDNELPKIPSYLEFGEKYKVFYFDFNNYLDKHCQTKLEIQKYGSHQDIYNNIKTFLDDIYLATR